MPKALPFAPRSEQRAFQTDMTRIVTAIQQDSPRAVLKIALFAGGINQMPNLLAVAVQFNAMRVARELLAHGWPAESISHYKQNALWHAIHVRAEQIDSGVLARELLQAGANASFIGPAGSVFGEAAAIGDTAFIELMIASRGAHKHLWNEHALSQGLWEASGVDSSEALAGCLALGRAGAHWTYQPPNSCEFNNLGGLNVRLNCAQHAAFTGPVDVLAEPAALAALLVRHPPRKGRGPWTGWHDFVPPDRLPLVERWILSNETPSAPPAPSAARLRL